MERRAPPNEALADYQRRNCGGCEHADAELVGTGEPCCNRTWHACPKQDAELKARCEAGTCGNCNTYYCLNTCTRRDEWRGQADHDRRNDEAAAKWQAEAQAAPSPEPKCPVCGKNDVAEGDSVDIEGNMAVQQVTCGCGAVYNEWYAYSNAVLVERSPA